MNTIQWKNLDFWKTRRFAFWLNNKVVGELNFTSFWNHSAIYSYQNTSLKFSETGLWKQKIAVQQNNTVIALIEKEFFGDYILQMRSGHRFKLVSNIFGKNVRWINQKGEVVMKYYQAPTISSMGKGSIHFDTSLNDLAQNILTSSGIFTRLLLAKRTFYVIVFMLFLAVRKG